jgi:hypothetical protein
MTCPLQIRHLRVRSLSVEHYEVSWELEATMIDVLSYTFQVLRSEGVEGPYDPVSEPFRDKYLFVDNAVYTLSRSRQTHYKLRVCKQDTSECWEFGPASAEQETDLISSELRSHISLLMHEFIGERCWVLPVRTFGQRCPTCWSPALSKRTRSGCTTCWETSFIRGYMHPIESWISLDPSNNEEQMTPLGKLQQVNSTARMAYYPPCKAGDLIVFGATNDRYRVTSVGNTRHVGTPVHQELRLHMVPQTALEYSVPIDLGEALTGMFLKPARNYTNPQQLESLDDQSYGALLGLSSPHGVNR